MQDLISRQAAIDAYGDWYVEEGTEEGFIGTVKQLLEGLPSAQSELDIWNDGTLHISISKGQLDKIGRVLVEEDGTIFCKLFYQDAEPEIIRCKDCKYYREYGYVNGNPKFLPKCTFNSIYVNVDDFCSKAERR